MQNEMITAFIRQERKNQNLLQEDLAELAGVSTRSISNIELGESVRKSTIEKVLKALGYQMVIRYEFVPIKNKYE